MRLSPQAAQASCEGGSGRGGGLLRWRARSDRLQLRRLNCQGLIRRVGLTTADDCGIWFRVRYPDGGGLMAEGRARREAVRLQAAELFA